MPNFGGGVSGAMGGASRGASIGSVIPGIGTAIGGGIGGIIGGIRGLFGGGKKKSPLDPTNIGNQYQEFANTGGYSPEDRANIRSRALSPTRAVYANAQRGIERQRALQGGYSPNFTAASAKMAREQSQGLSDTAGNTEANLAQMIQEGKLKGLEGMSRLYQTDQTTPSDYQRKLSSIGGTANLIGKIGGSIMSGFGGGGGGGVRGRLPLNSPGVYGAF